MTKLITILNRVTTEFKLPAIAIYAVVMIVSLYKLNGNEQTKEKAKKSMFWSTISIVGIYLISDIVAWVEKIIMGA